VKEYCSQLVGGHVFGTSTVVRFKTIEYVLECCDTKLQV